MFCPRCGSSNEDDAAACTMCGFGLREAAAKIAEPPRSSAQLGPPPASRAGTMLGVAIAPPGSVMPEVASSPTARVGTMPGFAAVPEGSHAPPVVFHAASAVVMPAPAQAAVADNGPTSAAASYAALKPSGTMGFAMPPVTAQTAPTAHALTPDASPLTPRRMVAELVSRHGHALIADPQRCAVALIEDYQRQVSLLVAALEHGIPQRLLANVAQAPIDGVVTQLSQELAHALAIPQAGARWAVESWALSFQLLLPHAERRA